MKKTAIFLFSFFVLVDFCVAQDINTDRPTQTTSPTTVIKGSFQIESGFSFVFSDDELIQTRLIYMPTVLFRYAPLDFMELRFQPQVYQMRTTTGTRELTKQGGIDNFELGLKFNFNRSRHFSPQFGAFAHVVLPTSTSIISNDVSVKGAFLGHHLVSKAFSISYNVGGIYDGDADNGILFYTLDFDFAVNDKLSLYVEHFGETTAFDEFDAFMNAGLTFKILSNLQADVAFGAAIDQRLSFFSFGISWLYPRPSEKLPGTPAF